MSIFKLFILFWWYIQRGYNLNQAVIPIHVKV